MQCPAVVPTVRRIGTNNAADLAYILAVSYSGSTLLAMLLGSQPEAVTVGEMRAPTLNEPDTYLCSCGEPIKICGFWTEVSRRMAERGIADFDITRARLSIHDTENAYLRRLLDPLPRGPFLEAVRQTALSISRSWRTHLRDMHQRNRVLVDVLREMTGAKVVIDSSKIAFHLKCLLKSPDLRTRIIWLIRDGRAVTMSMLGHGFKRETRQDTVAAATLSWRRNNEAAERVLAELPASQWMCLQYEQLCRHPEETLRSVCKFLGMDTHRVVLDFRLRQQHVLGNDMRLNSSADIRLDERWRTGLSTQDLATFEEVAGDLNQKYGYQ